MFLVAVMFLVSRESYAGLEGQSAELVDGLLAGAPIEGKHLAVGDFSDSTPDRVSKLSDYISDCLEAALVQRSRSLRFKVIERRNFDALAGEWKLGYTGLVSPDSTKKAGKLLGVDVFLIGKFTVARGWVRVRAKLVESETGEILAAGSFHFEDVWSGEPRQGVRDVPPQPPRAAVSQPKPEPPQEARQGPGAYSLAIGANYFGGQIQYLSSSGRWAAELRYVTGRESSDTGTMESRVTGLRGYRFCGGKRLRPFLGIEADYVTSNQKGTAYSVSGFAAGGFGGIQFPIGSRLSFGIDIGPYVFSLREESGRTSSSSLEFVANSFLNFYVF
ncbi:MAG: hypothetical protein NTX64_18985 [Elusimicrobia bacterium]|nr:hypothetical protein [Elusimicrobiota bacterium]